MRKALPKTGGQHAGLLLQRYFASPQEQWEKPAARMLLFDRVQQAGGQADLGKVYTAAFERWRNSFPEVTAKGLRATNGRLIIGLGAQNVLETGLTLHHTYGVPIIPGSALKGLTSHYCAEVLGTAENGKGFERGGDIHNLLFGTTGDGGVIAFHDAWITPETMPIAFKLDVMTPHHPQWQDEKAAPPTDFDSPNPISFLSIAGTFLVAVSWVGPPDKESIAWTNAAFKIVMQALENWGVGGKTSSGYGRFETKDADEFEKAFSPTAMGLPLIGEKTRAQFQRHKKGMHRGKLLTGDGRSGPILNAQAVPAGIADRAEVELVVVRFSDKGVEFSWPE